MRQTRSNNNQPNKPNNNNNEKIYYIIIGVLLVILLAIVIFIFANRDSATDLDESDINPETGELLDLDETDDEDETEADEETDSDSEETEEEEDPSETEPEEEETDTETDETEEDTDVDEETEEDTDVTEETEESDYEVTEDAPLDESHQVNYSDGSSDRIAIANAASSITGLDPNEMITNWVGNDGPGRVFSIVSNVSQTEVYRLTLQYGEGQWHVTGVQELDSVPTEYN